MTAKKKTSGKPPWLNKKGDKDDKDDKPKPAKKSPPKKGRSR